MIVFKFETKELFERAHLGLKGSPAYFSSEIAIVEDEEKNPNGFYVVVGNENENDIEISVKEVCL